MFTDYYGLSFNPFDKQCIKERDAFRSQDHRQMQSRLDYLKTVRGIGVFTARPGMGKTYALRCFMNGLKVLCMEQAEQLHRDEEEISALKKQVMELTLSVREYKGRLLKIEELSRL